MQVFCEEFTCPKEEIKVKQIKTKSGEKFMYTKVRWTCDPSWIIQPNDYSWVF